MRKRARHLRAHEALSSLNRPVSRSGDAFAYNGRGEVVFSRGAAEYAKGRRVRKATQNATTTFFYDGWNLLEERIVRTDGTASTVHYYWGRDLSGSLHGAGGVGGLDGGLNLYAFCGNSPVAKTDGLGMEVILIKHLPGEKPLFGWPETDGGRCLALTVYRSPTYSVSEMKYPGGKIMFKVEVVPPNSFVDVYFRTLGDYMTKMRHESDHVSVARRHERAIHEFKRTVEAIHDCPTPARKAKEEAEMRLVEEVGKLSH